MFFNCLASGIPTARWERQDGSTDDSEYGKRGLSRITRHRTGPWSLHIDPYSLTFHKDLSDVTLGPWFFFSQGLNYRPTVFGFASSSSVWDFIPDVLITTESSVRILGQLAPLFLCLHYVSPSFRSTLSSPPEKKERKKTVDFAPCADVHYVR